MLAKLFLFMKISLLRVLLFVIAVTVMNHRRKPPKFTRNKKTS